MRVLLVIAALALAAPAFAATSEPPAPTVAVTPSAEPVRDAKKAMPERFLHYDSRRIMMRPMQLDDRVRPQRLGPTTTDPKDRAGPEIR